MNDKTIQELREFYKSAVFNCWLNKRGADVLGDILSRAEQEAKEEPLAVLADRKGVYIAWEANYEEEWHIGLDGVRVKQEDFKAPTYPEAEAKARAYLAGLPDKEAA